MTAEEFFKEKYGSNDRISTSNAILLSIEFAKYHVEQALKEASEKAISREDIAIFAEGTHKLQVVDRLSILNAYPLTNIK